MPKYLDNFYTVYSSDQAADESKEPLQSVTTQPSHPLSTALVQSIYDKAYCDGITSTFLHRAANLLNSNPITSTMVFIFATGAIALSSRITSPSKVKTILGSLKPALQQQQQQQVARKQIRLFGTTLPSFTNSSTAPSAPGPHHGNEGSELVQPKANEYDKLFEKFRQDLLVAQDQADIIEDENGSKSIACKVSTNGTDPVKFSSHFDANSLVDAIQYLMEQKDKGFEGGSVTFESVGSNTSIPSTYYAEDSTTAPVTTSAVDAEHQKMIDEQNAQTPSQVMATEEVWSEVRFEIVSFEDIAGSDDGKYMHVDLWHTGSPDDTKSMKILASTKDGRPTIIYHNGLLFDVVETDDQGIWRFENLALDLFKTMEMSRLKKGELYRPPSSDTSGSLLDPALIDMQLHMERENNIHLFRGPVPEIDNHDLIEAIERGDRIEFWLDHKIGKTMDLRGGGRNELWTVRCANYSLYGEPEWFEVNAVVQFYGLPIGIIIDEHDQYVVDVRQGDQGQYLIKGQEEKEDSAQAEWESI
ncbi:uncharacterized protein IL334_001359 [Kwoniella shivajii]|uniref:Uncharacterized protein n=1 Tax=Kwoniella shivajii TaxID=564305 RepID=A0ABZ1CSV1_9TREE|nr:hypothetical protein IL334_001359 [Kwoniella shivajii]